MHAELLTSPSAPRHNAGLQRHRGHVVVWYSVAVLVALGAGSYGYSAWKDHVHAERDRVAREQRRLDLAKSVDAMAERTNALTGWGAALVAEKRVRLTPILTAELQKLWISERPILFIGNVIDVAMNLDGTYQLVIERRGVRPRLLSNEIRVNLRCREAIAAPLIETAKTVRRSEIFADMAVVAEIDRVASSTERNNDGDTVAVLTGFGKCVDALRLTERTFWQ